MVEILGRPRIQPFVRTKVVTTSYTVTLADAGWMIMVDTTGGAITITLPPVATAGDGFVVTLKRITSGANALTIDADGTETIDGATTLLLPTQYQSVTIVSRSTGWFNGSMALSVPPVPQSRSISTGTGLTGGGDLSADRTISALAASDSQAGVQENATQAEQVTGTSVLLTVTPGTQLYHPSALKGWVLFNGNGTVSDLASLNVTSITDNGTGTYTVNWTAAFDSSNYAVGGICKPNGVSNAGIMLNGGGTFSASAVQVNTQTYGGTDHDASRVSILAAGVRA